MHGKTDRTDAFHILLPAVAALLISPLASGQENHARPIRMIVPFSAGASPDVMTRIVADTLSRQLGTPVIVENKAGAGGNIGAEYAARQPGDGHTIFVGSTANLAVNKTLYAQLPYDPERDFRPVSIAWVTRNVLIVPAGAPYRSVRDVIARARAEPGKLTYGSPGPGTAGHLIGELFQTATQTKVTHVPYKGQNQVVTDLLGGHIDFSFETIGSALPNIESGKVRALAITGSDRHSKLPDTPTFSEAGVPSVDRLQGWAMFAVPAATPPAVVQRLQADLAKVLADEATRGKLTGLGVDLRITTPDQTRQFLKEEVERWGAVVRSAGLRFD